MSGENIITVGSIRELKELVDALEEGTELSISFEDPPEEEEDDGW